MLRTIQMLNEMFKTTVNEGIISHVIKSDDSLSYLIEPLGDGLDGLDIMFLSECGGLYVQHWASAMRVEDLTVNLVDLLNTRKWELEKLIEVLNSKFDPIENYNSIEEETINDVNASTGESHGFSENSASNTLTVGGQSTDTKVAPYNTQEVRQRDVTVTSDRKDSSTSGGDSSVDSTTKSTDNRDVTRKLTRHGNIGVTTSQQMLESSIELAKFNFARTIMLMFKDWLCSNVYSTEPYEEEG